MHSLSTPYLQPDGSPLSGLCVLEMPVLPACTTSLSPLTGSSDVTASPWQLPVVPPPLGMGPLCEKEVRELAASQPERLHLCARIVNDGAEKKIYVGKKAGSPWDGSASFPWRRMAWKRSP